MNRALDYENFVQDLTATAEVLRGELSGAMFEGYYEALEDLPLETVRTGLRLARGSERYMPAPIVIRELVLGSVEARAMLAWHRLLQLARRARFGQRVDLGDSMAHAAVQATGGWRRYWPLRNADMHPAEVERARQDFVRAYTLALRTPELLGAAPRILVDKDEQCRGLAVGPVLRVTPVVALTASTSAPRTRALPSGTAGLRERLITGGEGIAQGDRG